MALKTLIFFGLLALALGFTLPEEKFDGAYAEPESVYGEPSPLEDGVVLIRTARSPQGRLETRYEDRGRMGSVGSVDYSHPINKNWDAYVKAERNYKLNDNSAHTGFRFKF